MTTTTHVGDGVEDETAGQITTFIRKVSNANAAVAPKRARGASTAGQLVGDGGKR